FAHNHHSDNLFLTQWYPHSQPDYHCSIKMMNFNNRWQLFMMIASVVLLQARYGHGHRKFQPNTYGEFKSLACKGDFDENKGAYSMLRHICQDCYNLYRDPKVEVECMSNCFQNKMFKSCAIDLITEGKRHEYENHVEFLNNEF
ncbi:unnamed protein product, partial [Meganyctiphanes norvegica]